MASIAAYNRMMLTPWFYRLFAGYRHILLYQLDCLMLGMTSRCGASWTGAMSAHPGSAKGLPMI